VPEFDFLKGVRMCSRFSLREPKEVEVPPPNAPPCSNSETVNSFGNRIRLQKTDALPRGIKPNQTKKLLATEPQSHRDTETRRKASSSPPLRASVSLWFKFPVSNPHPTEIRVNQTKSIKPALSCRVDFHGRTLYKLAST